MRIKIIFISKASHLGSLGNRGLGQLGNGLLPDEKKFMIERIMRADSSTAIMVGNTLQDLHNSSDYSKAESHNCFIIHS